VPADGGGEAGGSVLSRFRLVLLMLGS